MNCIPLLLGLLLPLNSYGQSFVNEDLDGTISVSSTPTSWLKVDYTDPVSLANNIGTDIPDVCGLTGPVNLSGISGNPYSGNTFLSGVFSEPAAGIIVQEGIQQTVSGFSTSVVYTVNFYQAVVKQSNLLDQTGGWDVYVDNTLIATSAISTSTLAFDSNNLVWEFRSMSFLPTLGTHTIKFLPHDDDGNQVTSSTDITGALRMGIDSIYLEPILDCNLLIDLGPDTLLCTGDTLVLGYDTLPGYNFLWSNGLTDSIINVDTAGTYILQLDTSLCSYGDTIVVDFVLDTIDLGNDTLLCIGDSILFDVTTTGATYLWSDGSTDSALVVSQADTVWVDVNIGNCTYTDTVIVTYYAVNDTFLGPDTSFCVGTSIDIETSLYGSSYLWDNTATDSLITLITEDTVWLEVVSNGCLYTDTIAVTYYPILNLDLGNDTTLCEGDSIALDVTMSDVTYLWSDNSTDSVLTVGQADTIWVDVMQNGCIYSDTIIIDYFTPILVDLGNDTILCQGVTITLDATDPAATGYLWSDLSINSTLMVGQIDTVWVEVSDANCVYTDTIEINYHPLNDTFLGPDTLFCVGTSIDIETSLYGDSYLWDNGSTDSLITLVTEDTVWLDVLVNGCLYSDTVAVNYFPILNVDLGNDTILCEGDSLLLDVTMANVTYLWSDNSVDSVLAVGQPDTIWVDVMQNGCIYSDTIIVDYYTPIVVDLGNDTTLCSGNTITLDATDPVSTGYLWSDLSINPTLTISQIDTVWVEVSDANCVYTDTIEIDYFPLNDTFLGPDTSFCFGSSVEIETSLYGTSYLWDNGTTDSVITLSMPDTVWLDVNLNGCFFSDTIIVTNFPVLNVDLGNDTILCLGNSITLDATAPNASYVWNTAELTPIITVSQADTIWVDVTQNGCVYTDSIIVDYYTPIIVDLGNDTTLCEGADITLDATDPAAISYLWSDFSTNPTLTVLAADTVWVQVSDVNCTYIDSIEITYYPALDIGFPDDTTLCVGDSLVLSTNFVDATYLWSDLSIDNKLTIFSSCQVWLDVTQYGCLYTDSIDILFNSLPIVDLGPDTTFCEGTNYLLDAQNPGSNFEWHDLSNSQTFTVTSTGDNWVTVTDVNGCEASDTVYVEEAIINIDLGPDLLLCDGETQVFDASHPNATYVWQNASVSNTFTVTSPDTYFVTVTVDNCSDADTVIVDYVYLSADFDVQSNACVGEEVSFTNLSLVTSGNDVISSSIWDFGDNVINTNDDPTHIYFAGDVSYSVSLTVNTGNNCSATTVLTNIISVHTNPIANFKFTPEEVDELSPIVQFNNLSSDEDLWFWTFDKFGTSTEENPEFEFPQNSAGTAEVTLVVTDNFGCVDSILKEIHIKENVIFYVPNAFTPDSYGFNSLFIPVFTDGFDPYSYHMSIYNKWGEIVFESYNHEVGWDGTYANTIMEMGVFIWKIEFDENIESEKHIVTGHVTLLR